MGFYKTGIVLSVYATKLIRTCFNKAAYTINRGILGKNWKSGVNSRDEWFFNTLGNNMDLEALKEPKFAKFQKRLIGKTRTVFSKRKLFDWIPLLTWLPSYDLQCLSGDLIAGLTCALTIIPQGIGYAPLAGLPVQVK